MTFAEIKPDPKDYPGALPHMLKAGSLVFTPPKHAVDLSNWNQWWNFKFGANWRRPYGPRSAISGLSDHPVVHIAYCDALAYAQWAGKDLPTEAEWEFAARGGFDGTEFAWGDEATPGGRAMANTWQGNFPHENLETDGYERISPVTAFPANGYGLYDMIGNVWEWTSDWYSPKHESDAHKPCCIPNNPRGGREEGSYNSCQPSIRIARKALKGGSHLCAPNYCQRYRPAARHAQPIDTSTSHVGFRCVVREQPLCNRPSAEEKVKMSEPIKPDIEPQKTASDITVSRRNTLLGGTTLAAAGVLTAASPTPLARAQQRPTAAPGGTQPNILVIWATTSAGRMSAPTAWGQWGTRPPTSTASAPTGFGSRTSMRSPLVPPAALHSSRVSIRSDRA